MSPLDTTSAPFHQLFAGETAAYTPAFIRRTSNLSGIAAMLAATGSFVVCDSFMKLATADLPPFEVLFLRGVAASLACGLLVVLPGDGRAISSALHLRPLLRAAAETLSVLCYIVALSRLPIADVIALLQTAPLILILAVALLLGERVGTARVGLALVGFAGAFLVAQPGAAGISSAAMLAFAAAVLGAARDLIGRGVSPRIPVMVVTFATNVMVMAASAAMSLGFENWRAPTGQHLAFLGFAGLFVTFGHVGLLLAYRLGRTAAVAPFFYSFAVWAVLSGLFVFGALPNALALVGIALIVGSGVAIVLLDQRRGEEIALTEAL